MTLDETVDIWPSRGHSQTRVHLEAMGQAMHLVKNAINS